MGVKFGMEEGTFGPLLHGKFHPHRCNVSPLRGEKPQNWPLSKLNTGRYALRAMLPVMNGFHREHKIWNLKVNGVAVETNEEKSDIFAKRFSDISSDKNHSSTFLLWKKDIESYYKYLFENLSEIADKNRTESLNEPFDLHEVHRALREIKKTFCSWCRQNIV